MPGGVTKYGSISLVTYVEKDVNGKYITERIACQHEAWQCFEKTPIAGYQTGDQKESRPTVSAIGKNNI